MKKIVALIGFIVISLGVAHAQWRLSAVGGLSLANFSGKDKKDWGGTNTNPKIAIRYQIGIIAERQLSDEWMAGGSLQFSTKGTSYSGETEYYDQGTGQFEMISVKYSKILGYIDIPLYVKYLVSSKFHIVGGVQPGILLSAKVKNDENAQKAFDLPEKEDAKDYYGILDLAIIVGPQYQINDNMAVRLLFKPGIIKIAKSEVYDNNGGTEEEYFKVMNTVFDFSFIYTFSQ